MEDVGLLDVGGMWGVVLWGGSFFFGYELFGLLFVLCFYLKGVVVVFGCGLYVVGF